MKSYKTIIIYYIPAFCIQLQLNAADFLMSAPSKQNMIVPPMTGNHG